MEPEMAAAARPLQARLVDAFYASPLYGLMLRGGAPADFAHPPPAAFPGDPEAGALAVAGSLTLGKTTITVPPADWRRHESAAVVRALNGFAWLDDLVAAGGTAQGAALIAHWIDHDAGWHPLAWAPDVLGRRVTAWLAHAPLYADDARQRPRVLRSLARQLRHLARTAAAAPVGVPQLDALTGLVLGWSAGLIGNRVRTPIWSMLATVRSEQVLADGGHTARNPSAQLRALADLVLVREALVAAQEPEGFVDALVHAMAGMLRLFVHGDGGLALFNGASEGHPALIEAVLARVGGNLPGPLSVRASGFERIEAAHTVIVVDTGAPPRSPFDDDAHAGTLSFEMSVGAERLVVNCGGAALAEEAWRRAQRATAAHSTAVIDDTNSAEVLESGFGRRPEAVVVERESADGATWITAAHDGYVEPFGVIHRRRLFVARDGEDVRGEDTFEGRHDGGFAIRFHLHPDVKVSLMQTGAAALLRLPSGLAFRFQVSGAALDLEPSIYLGRAQIRRSEQLVASGRPAGGTTVKWAFRRIVGK
jgi:uncharacterized heparinase superfamily protein